MTATRAATARHRRRRARTALFAVFALVCTLTATIAQTTVTAPPAAADDTPPASAPPTLQMSADGSAPLACSDAPLALDILPGAYVDGQSGDVYHPGPVYAYIVLPAGTYDLTASLNNIYTANMGANGSQIQLHIDTLQAVNSGSPDPRVGGVGVGEPVPAG